jgi:hypothetical protein
MRKRWLLLGIGLCLVLSALLWSVFDPSRIVRGLVAGEPFYQGKPTSYWRRILRADGEQGRISRETEKQFGWHSEGVPVLLDCSRDPDRNVRWPAIYLLRRGNYRNQRILDLLIESPNDTDSEVRLQAILTLGAWERAAQPAIPVLTTLLQDPINQIAYNAYDAIWSIDAQAAVKRTGWQRCDSQEWHFSVMLPAAAEQGHEPSMDDETVVMHYFKAWRKPSCFVVVVSKYPEVRVKELAEEERLDPARSALVFGLGGKVVRDEPIELQGRKGREYLIEVQDMGLVRGRAYWVGPRFYRVYVASKPEFWNSKLFDYFLDSFRFEPAPNRPDP